MGGDATPRPDNRVLIPTHGRRPTRPPGATIQDFAGETMGTTWSVRLIPPPAVDRDAFQAAIEDELSRIIALFSHWDPRSELSRLNAAPPGFWAVSEPFWDLINKAMDLADDTNGAVDPSLGALVDLWGFGPPGPRPLNAFGTGPTVPFEETIVAARALSGWGIVRFNRDARAVQQLGGVKLDLSGIAKGHAVDRVSERLTGMGATHHLVEIGGELRGAGLASSEGSPALLVAFASQTGLAEELAWMTAKSLSDAGTPARVALLGDLEPAGLKAAGQVLIIASTTGEGDAPDAMSWFVRQSMKAPADLTGLSFGLLALGDRTYADFCGFGRALDGWLQRSGAAPLFDRVEVDNGDAGAIRHWQHQLALLTGSTVQPDWAPPALDRWRLVERTLLNPGSPGGEAWLIALEPVDHAPVWVAGDIAEIGLPAVDGQPGPGSREYSVASLPADGRAEFIVRLMHRPDGTPGLASGWLTRDLAPGADIGMRIRGNRSFHGPPPETPLILIGNGTGLAGLRAHWRARAGPGETWLMFGERTRAHDAFLDAELQAALTSGLLTRLDRTFSRDAGDGRYVQALIADHAAALSDWVTRGAVILVCGSLEGMSRGVHEALEATLGAERLRSLTEAGRYRRDVY